MTDRDDERDERRDERRDDQRPPPRGRGGPGGPPRRDFDRFPPRRDRPWERGNRPPQDRPFRPRADRPGGGADRRERPWQPRDSRPDDRPPDRRPRDAGPPWRDRPGRPGGFRQGPSSPERERRSFDGQPFRGDRPQRRPYQPGGGYDQQRGGPDRSARPPAGRPPAGRGFGPRSEYPPGPAESAAARPPRAADSDLLAEGEELVAGRRPVEEAFAASREARRLLVVPERRSALDALVLHATTLRIPVVEVEGGTLTSLSGFDGHQGVALAVAARAPGTLDDVLARARQRGQPAFVLVLDSLEDPQNLGTLLRSAEACAVDGVMFPTRRSAPLSPAAIKASAGATEHLLLVPVDDLAASLVDLRARGLRLIGADEGAAMRYGEADLRGPLALVVGSEGRGISGALRRRLDMVVRIPMRGRVGSLNAAVAGSVLLFAAAEQRGVAEAGEGDDSGAPASARPAADERSSPAEQPAGAGRKTGRRAAAAGPVQAEPPADVPNEPSPAAAEASSSTAEDAPATAEAPPADAREETAAGEPGQEADHLLPGEPAVETDDETAT